MAKAKEVQSRNDIYVPAKTLRDENGVIIKAFDKVKAADNPLQMLGELVWGLSFHLQKRCVNFIV